MDKGTSSGRAGQSGSGSADILSRIRATTASKPETKIRQLESALIMAQAELAQLKEEQEALAEAYAALEKERDNEVLNLKAELDKLVITSAALEKERDGWRSAALNPEPVEELTEKDTSALGTSGSKSPPAAASKPVSGNLALEDESDPALEAIHAGQSQSPRIGTSSTGGFMSRVQATMIPTPEQSVRQLKDKVQQLTVQLDQTKAENQDSRSQYNKLATDFKQAELELAYFKEVNMAQEKELSVLTNDLKKAQDLAANRGKELVGSQAFLAKADTVSMSEVIERVSNLNEEIFQAAALLGEALVFEPAQEMTPEETKQYTDYCTRVIGGKLTEILINEARKEGAHEVNPFLVQVVFQISVVDVCYRLTELWQPNQPQASELLEHIYQAIRDSEEQAVFGRWRSLTRKHIRPTTDVWKEGILKPISYICKIACWVAADEESSRAFEQKLPHIFKAVEELRLAIGEQFTSAGIHLALMKSDQPFIRKYMEDAYGDGGILVRGPKGRPPPPEIVLGTVGLGLKQASKDRLPNGDVVYHSIQPAKVALVSTVLEGLAPPPPRTKRKAKPQVQPAAAAPK